MSKRDCEAVHARLLIVDLCTPIHPIPIVTQLALWKSRTLYDPVYTLISPPLLTSELEQYVIQKSKDLICKMHAYATHLMDSYAEEYFLDETNQSWGVNIRYRISTHVWLI